MCDFNQRALPCRTLYSFAIVFYCTIYLARCFSAEAPQPQDEGWEQYSKQFASDDPQTSAQRKLVYDLIQKHPLDDAQQEEVDPLNTSGILLKDTVVRSMPTEKDGIILGEIKKGTSVQLNARSKDGLYFRFNYFNEDGFLKVEEVLPSLDLSVDPERFTADTPKQKGFFAELVPLSVPNPGSKPLLYEVELRLGWGLTKNLRTFITGTSIISPVKIYGGGIGFEFRHYLGSVFFMDIGLVPYARSQIHFSTGKQVLFFDFNLSTSISASIGSYLVLKLQVWSSMNGIILSKAPIREFFVPKIVLEIHV